MTTSQQTDTLEKTVLITQGEFAVCNGKGTMITTLLGSCVSCCLWDENEGVGGMNHLLLAGGTTSSMDGYNIAGAADMEYLINGMLKLGARRDNLQAKVFGGAQMLSSQTRIGASNAAFVLDFLQQENIACISQSIGGTSARSLKFWPASGRARMRMVNDQIVEDVPAPKVEEQGNDMELF